MDTQTQNQTLRKGDKVTTIHGEELEVLDVKREPIKRRKQFTGEFKDMFLAKSGDTNCWFPVSYIKSSSEKGDN